MINRGCPVVEIATYLLLRLALGGLSTTAQKRTEISESMNELNVAGASYGTIYPACALSPISFQHELSNDADFAACGKPSVKRTLETACSIPALFRSIYLSLEAVGCPWCGGIFEVLVEHLIL